MNTWILDDLFQVIIEGIFDQSEKNLRTVRFDLRNTCQIVIYNFVTFVKCTAM